jgi:hypothetical protein
MPPATRLAFPWLSEHRTAAAAFFFSPSFGAPRPETLPQKLAARLFFLWAPPFFSFPRSRGFTLLRRASASPPLLPPPRSSPGRRPSSPAFSARVSSLPARFRGAARARAPLSFSARLPAARNAPRPAPPLSGALGGGWVAAAGGGVGGAPGARGVLGRGAGRAGRGRARGAGGAADRGSGRRAGAGGRAPRAGGAFCGLRGRGKEAKGGRPSPVPRRPVPGSHSSAWRGRRGSDQKPPPAPGSTSLSRPSWPICRASGGTKGPHIPPAQPFCPRPPAPRSLARPAPAPSRRSKAPAPPPPPTACPPHTTRKNTTQPPPPPSLQRARARSARGPRAPPSAKGW